MTPADDGNEDELIQATSRWLDGVDHVVGTAYADAVSKREVPGDLPGRDRARSPARGRLPDQLADAPDRIVGRGSSVSFSALCRIVVGALAVCLARIIREEVALLN